MIKFNKIIIFWFVLFIGNNSFSQDSLFYYNSILQKDSSNIEALNKLAFFYSNLNKDSCFFFANKAYTLAVEKKDTIQIAKALGNIGESKTNLGQPDLVIKKYEEALKLFHSQNDYFQVSRILNRMGIFYNDIADDIQAERYYKEAIKTQYKHGIKEKVEYIFNNLSTSLYQQGKHEEALAYLDSALIIYENLNNSKGISYVYANKAYIYLLKKDYNKTKWFLSKSLNIIIKNNDESKKANIYKIYTFLYINLDNFDLAKKYADSAFYQTKKLNLIDLTNSTYNIYHILYKHFGEYKESLKYLEKFNSINDSLETLEKMRVLTEVRVQFDMELNEQKIKSLNNMNQLNQYKINSQTKWIWGLSFGLVLLSVLLSIILFLKKEKFRAEKKLVQKSIEQIDTVKPLFKKEDLIEDDSKYTTSKLTDEQKEELASQINLLFDEKKVFLNQDCSISLLEKELDTNKTYISQVINEKFEHNFKTILKEYRIKEATRLLIIPENKNLTIEGISQMVGFKSKSAFNTAFKSITGVTPSFFQKENITLKR